MTHPLRNLAIASEWDGKSPLRASGTPAPNQLMRTNLASPLFVSLTRVKAHMTWERL